VGFSFDDEPTVNSKDELGVPRASSPCTWAELALSAAKGCPCYGRRSNCSLRACSFPPCATRSPGRGRACPTLRKGTREGCPYPSWFGGNGHEGDGPAWRDPPTAKGLANIGVQENEICARVVAQGPRSGWRLFERCGFLPRPYIQVPNSRNGPVGRAGACRAAVALTLRACPEHREWVSRSSAREKCRPESRRYTCSAAPPKPQRGGSTARLESEPCATLPC